MNNICIRGSIVLRPNLLQQFYSKSYKIQVLLETIKLDKSLIAYKQQPVKSTKWTSNNILGQSCENITRLRVRRHISCNTRFNNIIVTAINHRTCNKSTNLELLFRCTKSNTSSRWASGYKRPMILRAVHFLPLSSSVFGIQAMSYRVTGKKHPIQAPWTLPGSGRRDVSWICDDVKDCFRGCTVHTGGWRDRKPSRTSPVDATTWATLLKTLSFCKEPG